MQPHVDKHLVTAEDLVAGGFAHLLAQLVRDKYSAERGAEPDRPGE
ncbi:MAG: hypothetical protein KDD77_06285 [Caldilineaceae bacterium]|nr:hypothetical protein [Caldilineaceae bacterium]